MASLILIICALLLTGFLATEIAARLKIPHSVFLVVLGLAAGGLVRTSIHASFPELVLYLFLPPLVFESAFHLDLNWLRRDLLPLSALAVVALVLSTILVGFSLHAFFALDLWGALIFGALISATDPVAVVALFKEVGAPLRLTTLVEGESLLNDGTAIVLFRALLAASVGQTFGWGSLSRVSLEFFSVLFGGGIFGILCGAIARLCLRLTPSSAAARIGITVVTAYASFILADHSLHISGVIAAMSAGLYLGHFARRDLSATTYAGVAMVWECLALSANTLVFLAVGAQTDFALLADHWRYIPVSLLIVYLARALSVFSVVPLVNATGRAEPIPFSYQLVQFWGGLRGGLALALILLLPDDFAQKNLFLALGTAVVLSTLFLNALTTAPMLRSLKLRD